MEPTQSPAPHDDEDFGLDKRELEHAEQLNRAVVATRKYDRNFYRAVKRWRKYAAGVKIAKDGDALDLYDEAVGDRDKRGEEIRANLIHSTFKNLMPAIAAKNPECAVSPTEAVDQGYAHFVRQHTRSAEIFINHSFRSGRFKMKLRRNVLSAFTTSVGWMKMFYQRDYGSDPIVQSRIDDAQDNIARIERMIAETDPQNADMSVEERQAEIQKLRANVMALEQQLEVLIAQGFVFDRVLTDDIVVAPSTAEMLDYASSDWMTHRIWIEIGDAMEQFGLTDEEGRERLKGATVYQSRAHERDPDQDDNGAGPKQPTNAGAQQEGEQRGYVLVLEHWHKQDRAVYTTIEGMKGYARAPWSPQKPSRRWYPFFALMFNDVDGKRWPLSDIEVLETLQDEYNETRSALREHRNRAVPATIGKKDDFSVDDANAIKNRQAMEFLLVQGPDDPTKPIQNSIGVVQYPAIDQGLYDTTPTRVDMDQLSGVQDAARGALIGSKTATEAAILDQGMSTRTSDRQDMVEEHVAEIAQAMYEIALQEVSYEEIARIAGPNTVWPGGGVLAQSSIGPQDLEDWVQVEIRGGSTGRPDKMREQQNWLQLFPVLQQAIAQIMQLRAQGLVPLADAQIALLKEMLRRFDERVDLEVFLGGMGMTGGAPMGPGGGVMPPPAPSEQIEQGGTVVPFAPPAA